MKETDTNNSQLSTVNSTLPKGWEIKKLGEVYNIKSSKRVHKKDWKEEGIPFYRAREVVKLSENGFVNNELFISPKLYDEFTKDKGSPKTDDIIISAVGTLGKCYLVKSQDKFYIKDASVLWFEKNSDVYSPYIIYAFKSDLITKQVMSKSMGATVGTLTISRAKNIEIPIPPLPEQKRIVSILDHAFEAIDQAKANAGKNLQNAKELFESYLNLIFEEKGKGWEEKKIKELGKVQTGSTPPTKDKENYGDYLPFAKPPHFKSNGNIETGGSMLSKQGAKKGRIFGKDSILMVCIGATIGKTGFSEQEISSNQQINVLTPTKDYFARFFYYAFISDSVQKQVLKQGKSAQATLPIINKTKWENILVSFPKSFETQKQIVAQLDRLQGETKKLEAIYRQKLDNLEEMKKSVLQKAFNGEL